LSLTWRFISTYATDVCIAGNGLKMLSSSHMWRTSRKKISMLASV